MNFDNKGATIYFECDGSRCNDIVETDERDFDSAFAEAKKEGWIALLKLTRDILETCIDVLGFSAPERM